MGPYHNNSVANDNNLQPNRHNPNAYKVGRMALRADHLHLRVPVVPGATDDRQDDSAVVWRYLGCLEHLHAVLPDGIVVGLCLRALAARPAPATPGHCPLVPAGPESGGVAGIAQRDMEANGRQRPFVADSGPAQRHDRLAVPRAFDDQPAVAVVVRAARRISALPPVCAVQFCVHAGAAQLSDSD